MKSNKKNKKSSKGLIKNSINYKVFSAITSLLISDHQLINHQLPELNFKHNLDLLAKKIYKSYNNQQKITASDRNLTPANIKRAIKKLESLDYLKIKSDNKNHAELKISFTNKGLQEYFRHKVNDCKNIKWDKKWRLVIFDILEDKRQARDLLRRKLKQFGFKELQKSVWIFPYDIKKEINQLLDVCNINIIGDIRFLTVDKIDNDQDLKKKFGL